MAQQRRPLTKAVHRPTHSILFVDDDDLFADAAAEVLRSRGHTVQTAGSLRDARTHDLEKFDCVVVDHHLPDGSGLTLASLVNRSRTRVVLVSATPRLEAAVEALRLGVVDFLPKPVDFDSLLGALRPTGDRPYVSQEAPTEQALLPSFEDKSAYLATLGRLRLPVLITGETGTGKGYLARSIHTFGPSDRPLVSLNCAALTPSLAEAELFGVERGAFTGAERRAGLLEAANEGTLFLDEIGELPLAVQAKVLTFLDDGLVRRVGGIDTTRLSVRIIAATNRDLERSAKSGEFRLDLLHRLDVARVELRPLRERPDDIAALTGMALQRLAQRDEIDYRLGDGELDRLAQHDWPGNIRELQNTIERSALSCVSGELMPSRFIRARESDPLLVKPSSVAVQAAIEGLEVLPLATIEREHVLRVLDRCNGNRAKAAALLGIGVSTLRRKLSEWSIASDGSGSF